MGSGGYGRFGEGYIIPRPTWDAKKDEVEQFYTELAAVTSTAPSDYPVKSSL
jgi:hypothetical protein